MAAYLVTGNPASTAVLAVNILRLIWHGPDG
jgi:hypothetical protein